MMKQFIILLMLVLCTTFMFAQSPHKSKQKKTKEATTAVTYTCPMDSDVISKKPGKCPKCGMELVKAKPVVYTCPMHPEIMSNKPGKCPLCAMALEVKKEENNVLKTNL